VSAKSGKTRLSIGEGDEVRRLFAGRLVHIKAPRVAESSGDKGTLGPSVGYAGKVPVDMVGSGVAVELITKIDQSLYGSDVDIVNRAKVKDDSMEERT
jgi:hypothetical protein